MHVHHQPNLPSVSIIVPNYNHARFLEERLQSIFAQTFLDFEVILLDDASTDDSRSIFDRYKQHEKVTHVVYNEANSGSPFLQWEKGLKLSRGEWVWIAESDDTCEVNFLETLVAHTRSEENIVLAFCQSKEINEAGESWRTMRWHTDKISSEKWKENFVADGLEEIKTSLWQINSIPNASAVLFRRDCYFEVDQQFRTMQYCGDWHFWIDIVKQGSVFFCAQPLNSFRCHSETSRVGHDPTKWRRRLTEEIQVNRHLQKILPTTFRRKLIAGQKRLVDAYCDNFSINQIITVLVNPRETNPNIETLTYWSAAFQRMLTKIAKRMLLLRQNRVAA